MTWDKVMKLRNRIRIFAVIFILALGMEYLPMAVYAAEVTAEESDMANDAEPDMDETPEPDNASETDKEDKTDVQDTGQNIPVTDIEISDHEEEVEVGKTINLTATALPANATESTITFRSSDINIATVTSAGEVKGISKGYVTIYVSAGSIIKETHKHSPPSGGLFACAICLFLDYAFRELRPQTKIFIASFLSFLSAFKAGCLFASNRF